jgi:hypothetical protein
MKRTLTLFILIIVLSATTSNGQGTQIRNLPSASSVNSGDMFPGDAFGGGTYKYTFSQLLGARTITCAPPLLCNGGSSMDLSADRTLSLSGPNIKTINVACTGVGATDTTAVSTALTSLQSSGGGKLHLSGVCSLNSRIVNNQPVSTFSPLIVEGDGAGATRLSFTSSACTGGSCIYLACNNNIGSGYCDGSGVRNMTIYLSAGQTGIELSGLENPSLQNLFINNGATSLKVGDSRGGSVLDTWLTGFTGYGIQLTGENFISTDFRHVTEVAGSGAVSCLAYNKTTAATIDGILLTDVVCNGTTSGPAFDFTSTTHMPGYIWMNSVIADGTFGTAGIRFQNFDKIFFSQVWSITHGTNASGIILDNTDQVNISGGEFWAGSGASASDLYLLNSVNQVTLIGTQFTGGILGVKVDSTTHDARILPGYNAASSFTNDATKLVQSSTRFSAPITYYTGTTKPTMIGMISPAGSAAQYIAVDSSGVYKRYADNGTTILQSQDQTGKFSIGPFAADSLLEVTANAASPQTPTLAGTLFHLVNADATNSRALIDAYGAANGALDFRLAAGTAASPSAVSANANGGQITWSFRGTTVYPSGSNASIRAESDEAQTDSAHGTRIAFYTTPLGASTAREVLRIDSGGHLISSGTAPTVACTGTGTSPTAPAIDSGGTDQRFTVTMSTGTGSPGSTGTCTVTFATAFSAARPIVCMLVKGASQWGNTSQIQETTESASAPVFTWTNSVVGVATALTVSTSYKFSCITL